MIEGFTDELEKTAKYRAVTKLMRKFKETSVGKSSAGKKVRGAVAKLQRSPELRSSVARGAGGGALIGGTAGVATGDEDDSSISRFLRGAAGGALLGGAAGGVKSGALSNKSLSSLKDKVKSKAAEARRKVSRNRD